MVPETLLGDSKTRLLSKLMAKKEGGEKGPEKS